MLSSFPLSLTRGCFVFWALYCREVRLCSGGKNNPLSGGITRGMAVKEEEANGGAGCRFLVLYSGQRVCVLRWRELGLCTVTGEKVWFLGLVSLKANHCSTVLAQILWNS